MKEYKILFTGPMGAGKTTAIGSVSDHPPVLTDVRNHDSSHGKALTAGGLDFGEFVLGSGERIRLFGTPGQSRFDFMWKILARNALGLLILIDNTSADPLADLRLYLEGFLQGADRLACAIGVGRLQAEGGLTVDDYADELARLGYVLPVLDVDVRRRSDVVLLIDTLLSQLEVDSLEMS